MHGVYDADNYAEISRTAGVYTRFSIRDSHADEECRGDFRGANRSTIVFKLGVLQDLRIFGGGGRRTVRNFKLERGFRGGRLSAWNLKIMRVLILRRLGDCSGRELSLFRFLRLMDDCSRMH